jgi:hypothetical protein
MRTLRLTSPTAAILQRQDGNADERQYEARLGDRSARR